jgi:DNA repair exonuclease SbcCD ATPase subunit
MLYSVRLPDADALAWRARTSYLDPVGPVRACLGYALFDARSHLLPRSGAVEVEVRGPLDGRTYRLRRALDVPEHWQVFDVETGWLAAAGGQDTERWLRANLDVPEELALPRLFSDVCSFSLPVTIGWLLEEAGVRERQLARLLRTERYPNGLRALDTLHLQADGIAQQRRVAAALLEGRDAGFERIQRTYEAAHAGLSAADEHVAALRLALDEAQSRRERLAAQRQEAEAVELELHGQRSTLAALEAELERWRHWLTTRERAARVMAEQQADWRAYQDAGSEVAKLHAQLSGMEAVRAELQAVTTDSLALQRERSLLEQELLRIHEAEEEAATLAATVQQQQQIEQQITLTQERALRLEQATRGVQATLAESKRVEVLLGEVERQIAELEPLAGQPARVKRLEQELEQTAAKLRETARQVDHLHFLETAIRAISGHLDELRKGAAVTERLAVQAGGASGSHADERTVASHLREAVEHQVQALERQLRDWQLQARELASAPQDINQLRASAHQLEQELASARKAELRLGAVPALRQNSKQLHERLEHLRQTTEAQLKEQQDSADAPAKLSQLRHDLTALEDPRSRRLSMSREAARKQPVEVVLRTLERQLQERQERQEQLDRQLGELSALQTQLEGAERGREEAFDGYCTYVAERKVAEIAAPAVAEVERVEAAVAAQRGLVQQTEARHTGLLASARDLGPAFEDASGLQERLAEAAERAAEWRSRYEEASAALAAAEEHRADLRRLRQELETHGRAVELLDYTRSTLRSAEEVLGTRLRTELAARASQYLRVFMDDPSAEVTWAWAQAPAVVRSGSPTTLDVLPPRDQACCALALRLAVAADASRLGTVFIAGLQAVEDPEGLVDRLELLPEFDQFLLPSGW